MTRILDVAIAAATISCLVAVNAFGDVDIPTPAELASNIQAQRDLLRQNFLVEVEMKLIAGPSGTVEYARDRVALSGAAFAVTTTLCDEPTGLKSCVKESSLWDGVTGAVYHQIGNRVFLYDNADEATGVAESAIDMNEWFTTLRWYPVTLNGALKDADLLSALQSDSVSVRPSVEVIGGSQCVVVDRLRHDGTLYETLWLDRERGFVPILQRHFASDGVLIIEREVTDVMCLPNGAWVPISGTKFVPAREDTETLSENVEAYFQVTLSNAGVPVVSCTPLSLEFDLAGHPPAGSKVVNSDGTLAFSSDGGDTASTPSVLPDSRLARAVQSARSASTSVVDTRSPLLTLGVAVGAIAFGVGLAQAGRRGATRRV